MAQQSTKPSTKWKFAIGTTSRLPKSGLHYLIADFDGPLINRPTLRLVINCCRFKLQATKHGWHLYTDQVMDFPTLIKTLKQIGADRAWIRIGQKRGYMFLADKKEIKFPWPVEHMVIHHGKEKAQNSRKA
jgi:hypothetical protein